MDSKFFRKTIDNVDTEDSAFDSEIKKAIKKHLKDLKGEGHTIQSFFYHISFCTIFAMRDIFAPHLSAKDEDGNEITDKYVGSFMSILRKACDM